MITIKLPYNASSVEFLPFLKRLREEQSSLIRFCYNRLVENNTENEIRTKIKTQFNNIDSLDSWYIASTITEAKTIFSSKKEHKNIIFGGRKNWILYNKKKITKEEFKSKRLSPVIIIGEASQKGNRKFILNITENKITFKHKVKQHFELEIPLTKGNYLRQLLSLERRANNKEIPFSIKLDEKYIHISFKEEQNPIIPLNKNRVLSIDMNPGEIGYSVLEFKNENEFKVIETGILDNSKLIKNQTGLKSNHPKKIKLNNKRKFEVLEVSKFLVNKAIHYKCSKFIIEDLNIAAKNHNRGNEFNRLVNNVWCRNTLINNLQKRCNINHIELVKINSAYTSFIGNALFSEKYPDPISSSIEIGRRGYNKFVKGKFYPKLIAFKDLPNQWKEEVDNSYESWLELFNRIKKAEIKYHFSWKDPRWKAKFLSFKSNKSGLCHIIV